ncbi:MAG TPA: adenylyltransferase/cytidyltransferase family protein, partial [Gemmatimonadales bacterium]
MNTAPKIRARGDATAWRRAAAGPVVFTNGVFDILHAGHVALLEAARAAGGALVVGVNSDASARRLGKGPDRPLVG